MNRNYALLLLLLVGCATVPQSTKEKREETKLEQVYLPITNEKTGKNETIETSFIAVINAAGQFRLCILRPSQQPAILKPETDKVYILPQKDFPLTLVVFLSDAVVLEWIKAGKVDTSNVKGYLGNKPFLELLKRWFTVTQWPPNFDEILKHQQEPPPTEPTPTPLPEQKRTPAPRVPNQKVITAARSP